ncbi:type II toxin-antitoxin system RelE/ParE family toxin [Motilimonas eburnea]|uniref:type II toxin-antitoxin system RelE/ParE family toxin n=1 Tax=Motilimonas eburnea TaxID=1737488 RepID=UPI001E3F40E5|nr:type II toxin-antitoxin system RelE/ParE family toxin [Motilimonas eburnea]MCE2573061.1 type II toxin-antitoxin system RelE/ParE family toxin [Motilimonas eburnea]
MNQEVRIEYTETFEQLTNNLISFMAHHMEEDKAIEKILATIEHFEDLVKENPLAAPLSLTLLDLGIKTLREYKYNGLRILYKIKEQEMTTIQCSVIISQRQDIERVLVDHCILYK